MQSSWQVIWYASLILGYQEQASGTWVLVIDTVVASHDSIQMVLLIECYCKAAGAIDGVFKVNKYDSWNTKVNIDVWYSGILFMGQC